jgi:hypothetical protein
MTIHSTSSVGLARQIEITTPLFGQQVSGWITSTQTSTDEKIFYGFFATQEQALEWAMNLVNATIEPVYHPAFNAG